eukprot:3856460-Prymnesium_polylepis.1
MAHTLPNLAPPLPNMGTGGPRLPRPGQGRRRLRHQASAERAAAAAGTAWRGQDAPACGTRSEPSHGLS